MPTTTYWIIAEYQCPECEGTGQDSASIYPYCPDCEGRGTLEYRERLQDALAVLLNSGDTRIDDQLAKSLASLPY